MKTALQIDITYDQILWLVRQLPQQEKIALTKELEKEGIESKLSELLAACQRIGQLYDENTPAFAAASVTPAVMSAFAAALAGYSASLNEQTAATNKRVISAITRKQQLVEIYETLTKWCLYGQMIWKGESEAFYKNYLLTRIIKGRKKRKKKAGGKQKKGDE